MTPKEPLAVFSPLLMLSASVPNPQGHGSKQRWSPGSSLN